MLHGAIGTFADELRRFSHCVTDGVNAVKKPIESKPMAGGELLVDRTTQGTLRPCKISEFVDARQPYKFAITICLESAPLASVQLVFLGTHC